MKKTFRVKKLHLFVVLIGFICAFTFLGCNHKPNYATQYLSEEAYVNIILDANTFYKCKYC
jgi:hypothetical protein